MKRPQNELGVWGILWLLLKSIKEKGALRLILNPYRLAQSSSQENRKGRVLGLYVKRPALENLVKSITM